MTTARSIIAALSLCTLCTPAIAAEKPPEVLKGGSWTMDYAADSCRLGRSFGDPADPVLLFMEFTSPGRGYHLTLVGKRFATSDLRRDVTMRWNPGGEPWTVLMSAGKLGQATPMLMGQGPAFVGARDAQQAPGDANRYLTPQQEAAARSLEISYRGKVIVLETGPMRPPMDAVRLCMDKLLEGWGLDPAEQAALASWPRPIGNPGNWVVSNDYPKGALSKGQQAQTNFRLIIGPNGLPESCNIQSATAGEGFREIACKALMKRARFEPARDAKGEPRRSYYVSSVLWVVP